MSKCKYLFKIVNELKLCAQEIEDEKLNLMTDVILEAKNIFIAGAGRSGFVARAFSNRLMHLGLSVHFIGESTTPAAKKGDLLIINSGSGETESLAVMAKKAYSMGIDIAAVTINSKSSIGKLAGVVIVVPGTTPKSNLDSSFNTIQPMGSAFEQMTWLLYDTVICYLMKKMNISEAEMFKRHANLE